ncbi:MAG: hypothetical protein JWO86_8526 [Myxococcaceae bacterium]|nr:hypothetical protein [Myxococcaceae bacterium]MEA2750045.1 hypothetical protein [Myxococcales bacterium]
MKRVFLFSSLFALASVAAISNGCVTRERVIVVKEPADKTAAVTPNGTNSGDDGQKPIAADDTGIAQNDESDWGIKDPSDSQEYGRVIAKVANMVSDSDLTARVRRRNLSLVNVTWEDTGRAQGSALGPNISDLTLQVRRRDPSGRFESSIMPVIRPPNFTDRTGDVPSDRFFVRIGNEQGQNLRSIPLTDVLKNLKGFAARPDSILGDGNVFAARDTHFLVSAQAVFLPIPKSGKAQFNPVLFNYQSAPGSPAVLTILVTRQGTSMQVIENKTEDATAAGWGQELYFDNKGQRAAFTAERKSDVAARIEAQGGPKTEDDKSALQKGADVLFLVQIPLKHAQLGRLGGAMPGGPGGGGAPMSAAAPAAAPPAKAAAKKGAARGSAADEPSDVEQAVLGHGPNVGPFNEGHSLKIERDPKFPIRITVQFYKATSNGAVSDIDLDSISRSIGSVYEHADAVGSLVMPDGDPRRPTAWQKVPHEWFPW